MMKSYFPWSYKKGAFLIGLLYYILVAIVASLLIGFAGTITGWIPVVGTVVGWVLRVIGIVVDVWVVIGIVLRILVSLKVIK